LKKRDKCRISEILTNIKKHLIFPKAKLL